MMSRAKRAFMPVHLQDARPDRSFPARDGRRWKACGYPRASDTWIGAGPTPGSCPRSCALSVFWKAMGRTSRVGSIRRRPAREIPSGIGEGGAHSVEPVLLTALGMFDDLDAA